MDIIEDKVTDLGRALFNAKYVDPRPLSGTNSNMAVLYAFTKPGETITTPASYQTEYMRSIINHCSTYFIKGFTEFLKWSGEKEY